MLANTSFALIMHVSHFPTFLLLQEVNSSLQNGGLVHFARMALALQHGAQLLDKHIKLVSSFLFRFVARCPSAVKHRRTYKSVELEALEVRQVPAIYTVSATNFFLQNGALAKTAE